MLLCVFDSPLAADCDLFLQDEPQIEVGVFDASAGLLQDLDVLEVGRPFQSQDGVDRQFGEMLFICRQKLRTQSRSGNVEQVLLEGIFVLRVIDG